MQTLVWLSKLGLLIFEIRVTDPDPVSLDEISRKPG